MSWIIVGTSPAISAQESATTKQQNAVAQPEAPAAAAPAAEPSLPELIEEAKRQAEVKEVLARLNGTAWEIELKALQGQQAEPGPPLTDTLSFGRGTVTSKRLSERGYPTSNFSLRIGGDGIPTWETMQTSEQQGPAFWRGELHGDNMQGVLSEHPKDAPTRDYAFVSTGSTQPAPPSAPSDATGASAADGSSQPVQSADPEVTPATSPANEARSKRTKKGWFNR